MTNDELREACERTGATVCVGRYGMRVEWPGKRVLYIPGDGDVIKAYAAELLVAEVREHETAQFRYQATLAGQVRSGPGFTARGFLATTEQRIRAAMRALAWLTTSCG